MSNNKNEEKVQNEAELTNDMLKELLILSEQSAKSLKEENKRLRESQLLFRDQIAMMVYPNFIQIHSSYEKACIDAYAAADIFLRQRDLGVQTVMNDLNEEQMDELRKLIKMYPNDSQLGKEIRDKF